MKQLVPAKTTFKLGLGNPAQTLQWMKQNKHRRAGICFIGRSNVGKSSIINSIFGGHTAKVSATPGKTREINIFNFYLKETLEDGEIVQHGPFFLFDLPGYGYAKVSKKMTAQWEEVMDTFFSLAPEHFLMVNLRDSRHPDQKSDQELVSYFDKFELNKLMALNKIDKLKTQKERAVLNKWVKGLKKDNKELDVFKVSAETKQGLNELQSHLWEFLLSAL